jgi:triphosphoribosyl-dephospho-CoA synthase
VQRAAQRWHRRSLQGHSLSRDPDFASWDLELKARGLNPGTTADLTVATLLVAALCVPAGTDGPGRWHGS